MERADEDVLALRRLNEPEYEPRAVDGYRGRLEVGVRIVRYRRGVRRLNSF